VRERERERERKQLGFGAHPLEKKLFRKILKP
jgi:hypothetical protein